MPNYTYAKIYKIISPSTEKIYIGSTTKKYLCQRYATHRAQYKKYLIGEHHYITCFDILQYGDSKIVLIESYPCNTRDELLAKEQEYLTMLGDVTVNKYNAHGLNLEKRQRTMRQYIQDNQDEIRQYQKEYQKEYRKKNKIKEADVCPENTL